MYSTEIEYITVVALFWWVSIRVQEFVDFNNFFIIRNYSLRNWSIRLYPQQKQKSTDGDLVYVTATSGSDFCHWLRPWLTASWRTIMKKQTVRERWVTWVHTNIIVHITDKLVTELWDRRKLQFTHTIQWCLKKLI